jgi:hypothetical protein
MEIHPVGDEFLHAEGDERTDRHDKANSRPSELCEKRLINGTVRCINLS